MVGGRLDPTVSTPVICVRWRQTCAARWPPRSRRGRAVLGTGTKVPFVVATTDSAREAGIKAGDLVGQIAPLVGGRGGGKPDLGAGFGTDVGGADAAMARIRELALR